MAKTVRMRGSARWFCEAACLAGLVSGCSTQLNGDADDVPMVNIDSEFEQASNLEDEFARAAADFDVPVQILKSIGYAMTGWHMVEGEVEFEGREARMGIMGVPERHLEDLAMRLNTTASEVAFHRETNIRAAATRLTELANGQGIDRSDIGAWAPVVAEYAEIPDEDGTAALIHDEVYSLLSEGLITELGSIEAIDTQADYRQPTSGSTGGDGRGAIWRPSPNVSSRGGAEPSMVVVHTCEGTYSGCWSWLTNSSSGVSAHYVVNSDGSEVSQLALETEKAWHVGATYDCENNEGVDCWRNGGSINEFAVGIEHAGYASQSSWSSGLIARSAELLCGIASAWDIPVDRYHVVGHGQLQPYNRVDPGPNWPWTDYLARAGADCGGGSPAADPADDASESPSTEPEESTRSEDSTIELIIDSNNAANDLDAELEVSGYWTSSNNVPGYYNTGYWWRSTASDSDAASFWFYLAEPARITADAWWPEAEDRAPSAPFMAYDSANNRLATVYVDQQRGGGRWNELGTWSFPAGWNRIVLSRWTTPGYVVVADAVRVRSAE